MPSWSFRTARTRCERYISALIGGECLEPYEKICAKRRAVHRSTRPLLQPRVIVAEGTTDITVLKRSLERLYSNLQDYFSFFDYEESRAEGSASALVRFLKSFA